MIGARTTMTIVAVTMAMVTINSGAVDAYVDIIDSNFGEWDFDALPFVDPHPMCCELMGGHRRKANQLKKDGPPEPRMKSDEGDEEKDDNKDTDKTPVANGEFKFYAEAWFWLTLGGSLLAVVVLLAPFIYCCIKTHDFRYFDKNVLPRKLPPKFR